MERMEKNYDMDNSTQVILLKHGRNYFFCNLLIDSTKILFENKGSFPRFAASYVIKCKNENFTQKFLHSSCTED